MRYLGRETDIKDRPYGLERVVRSERHSDPAEHRQILRDENECRLTKSTPARELDPEVDWVDTEPTTLTGVIGEALAFFFFCAAIVE